jgi:photosystem II stability/assembly factor-like uncharacterized protein
MCAASSVILAIAISGLTACGGGSTGTVSNAIDTGGTAPIVAVPAPVFTSGLVATITEGETGVIYTVQATVAAGQKATYSLSGADAAKFTVNAATGAIAFKSAPSYAAPGDADGDNEYLVTVAASDSLQTVSQKISLQVLQSVTARAYSWSNAPWGAGGYVTGILYHPSVQGLAYVRTDVGGVYRRDSATSSWLPLNDNISREDFQLSGIESMAVDPNDSQKLYLAAGQYLPSWAHSAALLRSIDRGATWTRTDLPFNLGGNSDGRGSGERLAVDPNKGSILFLGTNQDGLYTSTDSGATWSKVSGFTPAATTFVVFDKSTGFAGSATRLIYVGVATTTGSGLLRSADGGTTWIAVSGQPLGLFPTQGALDGDGHLYLAYADTLGPNGVSNGSVWRLTTATNGWSNITPLAPSSTEKFGYGGISVSAQNPNIVVTSTIDRWASGDEIYRSSDGGLTWIALKTISNRAAPSNPWLTAYYNGALSAGLGHWISDIEIDPFDSASAIFNTGYGIWESHDLTAAAVNWVFNDAGIEETAVTKVLSTKSGAHLLMTQGDVAGGRYTDLTPGDVHGYFAEPNASGLDIDAAELNPSLVVRTTSKSFGAYLSNDNGVSWSHMGASPVTSGDNGSIAISAQGAAMVWVPGGQGAYYSQNGGASWTASTGYPLSAGLSSGAFYRPVADRAADGYFYTYNFTTGEVLESVNNGQSFTPIISGIGSVPSWNTTSQLLSLPGIKRGDLWLANVNGLHRIDAAAKSVSRLSSVQEAYAIGYGAPAPGQTYYALYLNGKIGGVSGIYRSDDAGANWMRIDDSAHQFAGANSITGDPRVYGRVYLGTPGRGVIVGNR